MSLLVAVLAIIIACWTHSAFVSRIAAKPTNLIIVFIISTFVVVFVVVVVVVSVIVIVEVVVFIAVFIAEASGAAEVLTSSCSQVIVVRDIHRCHTTALI